MIRKGWRFSDCFNDVIFFKKKKKKSCVLKIAFPIVFHFYQLSVCVYQFEQPSLFWQLVSGQAKPDLINFFYSWTSYRNQGLCFYTRRKPLRRNTWNMAISKWLLCGSGHLWFVAFSLILWEVFSLTAFQWCHIYETFSLEVLWAEHFGFRVMTRVVGALQGDKHEGVSGRDNIEVEHRNLKILRRLYAERGVRAWQTKVLKCCRIAPFRERWNEASIPLATLSESSQMTFRIKDV